MTEQPSLSFCCRLNYLYKETRRPQELIMNASFGVQERSWISQMWVITSKSVFRPTETPQHMWTAGLRKLMRNDLHIQHWKTHQLFICRKLSGEENEHVWRRPVSWHTNEGLLCVFGIWIINKYWILASERWRISLATRVCWSLQNYKYTVWGT